MKRELTYHLLAKSDTIREAMVRMGSMNIVAVVDEDQKLVGTLTDGDIRRALLHGTEMEAPVEKIMNTRPMTAPQGWTEEELLELMLSKDKKQIPVVDAGGRVTDIVPIERIFRYRKKDNTVFILAGGKGSRLYPLTRHVPKPMLRVGEKPILETIIQQTRRHGFYDFVISLFHNGQQIKEYFGDGSNFGVRIRYTMEDKALGTAGPLSNLERTNQLPVIVINGDLLSKINLSRMLAYHLEKGFNATVGVRTMDFRLPFGVIESEGPRLLGIREKPTETYVVNAGVYILGDAALGMIKKDVFYPMTDLLADGCTAGLSMGCFQIDDYWLDIGTHETFEQALKEYNDVFNQ